MSDPIINHIIFSLFVKCIYTNIFETLTKNILQMVVNYVKHVILRIFETGKRSENIRNTINYDLRKTDKKNIHFFTINTIINALNAFNNCFDVFTKKILTEDHYFSSSRITSLYLFLFLFYWCGVHKRSSNMTPFILIRDWTSFQGKD